MMRNTKTILCLLVLTLLLGIPSASLAQRPMGDKPPMGMPPGGKGQMPPNDKGEKKEKKKKEKVIALETPKVKDMYMLGFSASFSDSLAFLTTVQLVDTVHYLKHNKLVDRTLYSIQLEQYAENVAHLHNSTNAVFYSTKKKALDKKLAKLTKMYKKSTEITLVQLKDEDFRFKSEEYIAPVEIIEEEEETEEPATTK